MNRYFEVDVQQKNDKLLFSWQTFYYPNHQKKIDLKYFFIMFQFFVFTRTSSDKSVNVFFNVYLLVRNRNFL